MKYVIDLERINQLTAHPNDNIKNDAILPTSVYSISKQVIRKYLEVYENRNSRELSKDKERVDEAIAILQYNKILLDESDIRDRKINQLGI